MWAICICTIDMYLSISIKKEFSYISRLFWYICELYTSDLDIYFTHSRVHFNSICRRHLFLPCTTVDNGIHWISMWTDNGDALRGLTIGTIAVFFVVNYHFCLSCFILVSRLSHWPSCQWIAVWWGKQLPQSDSLRAMVPVTGARAPPSLSPSRAMNRSYECSCDVIDGYGCPLDQCWPSLVFTFWVFCLFFPSYSFSFFLFCPNDSYHCGNDA